MKQKTYHNYLERYFPILIVSFISLCYSQNSLNTGHLKVAKYIYFVKIVTSLLVAPLFQFQI